MTDSRDGISSPTSGAVSAHNDKSLDGARESDNTLLPTAGVSEGAHRASEAAMAGNDSRGGVPLRSSCPVTTPDLERALEDADWIAAIAEKWAENMPQPPYPPDVVVRLIEIAGKSVGVACALLAEHARAERLAEELKTVLQRESQTLCRHDAKFEALEAQVATLREALEFYANPEIYKPHPHGPAFDQRDLSFLARTATNTIDGDRR